MAKRLSIRPSPWKSQIAATIERAAASEPDTDGLRLHCAKENFIRKGGRNGVAQRRLGGGRGKGQTCPRSVQGHHGH